MCARNNDRSNESFAEELAEDGAVKIIVGEEEELKPHQVVEYLRRLQLDDVAQSFTDCVAAGGSRVKPTLEMLDRIIYAHQKNIAFSTVDIVSLRCEPSLALGDLYQKIIVDRHGGFCFELNMLFEKLLRALGFDARACFSKSVRGKKVAAGVNHRAELVKLDGTLYFADVGFGGPMSSCALAVCGAADANLNSSSSSSSISISGSNAPAHYVPAMRADASKFSCKRIDESWWSVDRKRSNQLSDLSCGAKDSMQTELLFCTSLACDVDFHLLSLALSQPGSLFRDHAIVNLRTDDGYIAFFDRELKVRGANAASFENIEACGENVERANNEKPSECASASNSNVYLKTFPDDETRDEALLKLVGFKPYKCF